MGGPPTAALDCRIGQNKTDIAKKVLLLLVSFPETMSILISIEVSSHAILVPNPDPPLQLSYWF